MIKKLLNYIFPPKSKFKKGDEVIIDNRHISYIFNYNPDNKYTGKILKTFLATTIDDRNVYIYLVHLAFPVSVNEMLLSNSIFFKNKTKNIKIRLKRKTKLFLKNIKNFNMNGFRLNRNGKPIDKQGIRDEKINSIIGE